MHVVISRLTTKRIKNIQSQKGGGGRNNKYLINPKGEKKEYRME